MKNLVKKQKLLLVFILLIGAFFRFYNLNWDDGFHLHPDERFLTMVGNAIKIPPDFSTYVNPHTSTLNPSNVGFRFFVYGIFPLTFNKFLATLFHTDTYNDFTIQGRLLSGIFDLLVILVIYNVVKLFEKQYEFNASLKYWASFLYAISVLPIQLSHFFAVDTFLNFFMITSFYFSLCFSFSHFSSRLNFEKSSFFLALSAVFFGLALSSKLSALAIFPLNIFFITAAPLFYQLKKHTIKKTLSLDILKAVCMLLLYFFITYLTVRLADPYLFEEGNFSNPAISHLFLENVRTLKSWTGKDVWYPPAVQWLNKPPVLFSMLNLAYFGIGLPYFLALLIGFYTMVKKPKRVFLLVITLWTLAFFLYQSTQFVKTMRYFIFLYPFFAIIASFGLSYVTNQLKKHYIIFTIIILLAWPLAFMSIYIHKHSRVAASEWMYQNLESESIALGEYWDDPLPLWIENTNNKVFVIEQLPVFDQDTQDKWNLINQSLAKGDYLILSSNRGWGSIPTVPEKYPLMSKFYEDLLKDNLQYKKMKEFTSYPSLRYIGIPIDFKDDFADEAFTVYDHPKVLIFKKTDK